MRRGPLRYLIVLIGLCCLPALSLKAQRRQVSAKGTVTAREFKTPLPGVTVTALHAGTLALTDSTGRYSIHTEDGDLLIFSYIGYQSDTVRIDGLYSRQLLDVVLSKRTNTLATVEITSQRPDYARDSLERSYLYGDVLGQHKLRGFGAAGSPVTALYDAFSGRQKRIWRFQRVYEAFEEDKYINSRIRRGLVEELTGLQGDSVDVFLYWYNPSYLYVRNATDYQLFSDIKAAAEKFRLTDWKDIKSPAPIRMQDDE